MADRLENDVCTVAARELADLRDPLRAALRHHIARPELHAEIRAVLVPAHQNDAFGPELLRREYGEQPDRTVSDHGDRGLRRHPALERRVVPGAVDIGQRQ